MKKYNRIIIFVIGFLAVSMVILLLIFFFKKKNNGSDYKIGVLADDGIAMVSISKDRQMINVLKLEPESQVWIPKGMGWYRNEVVKKILQQEKKVDLLDDLLFYNFGFIPDEVIIIKRIDSWKNKFWWKLMWNGNLLNKEETMKGNVDKNDAFLDEIMIRDFSETRVVGEDIKLSVINLSEADGLANFMTTKMERLGFSITSVTSDNIFEDNKCRILYGFGVDKTFSWSLINNWFDCPKNQDYSLNENEIELYFDDNFSTMINYPSYKR